MSTRSFIENGDPSNVEVIISSSHPFSTQTQEPTGPRELATVINTRVEEKISSLKGKLLGLVLLDEWHRAKSIYDEFPDMVRIPLTDNGDTSLHVVVRESHTDFGEKLVNYKQLTPRDLEILNSDGNTAFCMAAITGNCKILEIMIEKNDKLPLIPGQDGMLPVHFAASYGYHKIVQDLTSENLLQKMNFKNIKRLFFMAMNSSMYDVAAKLVEECPEPLSIARDDSEEKLTAFHMLARKPSGENNHEDELLQKLCAQVEKLEYKKRMELITELSLVLFDAVKSGNLDFVRMLICMDNEILTIKDPKNGESLLHIVVLFRQHWIFNYVMLRGANHIVRAVDKDRNNVLHFAARQLQETSLSMRPDIQMQKELAWFKEVEMRVPPELRTMRNKDGWTPKDMFHANHRKLSDEVKDTAKGVANTGMVVATLIVAVAFSAALTTPGDKTRAWFAVFMIANAVALFTSSLSVVSFLSIFTSSTFTESDFITSLYPSLIIGKRLLFISVVTMIIAFAAASFLIFDHINKWVAYVVASCGLLTIIMFLQLNFNIFNRALYYFLSTFHYVALKLIYILPSTTDFFRNSPCTASWVRHKYMYS